MIGADAGNLPRDRIISKASQTHDRRYLSVGALHCMHDRGLSALGGGKIR
jgi:hypothetical protein